MKAYREIDKICRNFHAATAAQFPITSASDEFFYFPQVSSPDKDWSHWDDFSEDAVNTYARRLASYETALDRTRCHREYSIGLDQETQIDFPLLKNAITTLREQLTEVRSWERQPTFHLTIACLGIAEALEADDRHAGEARAKSLPQFIATAMQVLKDMPMLFRDLGLTMLVETRDYFRHLSKQIPTIKSSLSKLADFEHFLIHAKTQPDFCLPRTLIDKVIQNHLGCRQDIPSIQNLLESEIHDMQAILKQQADAARPGLPWEALLADIPLPMMPSGGLLSLYENQIQELAEHCLALGILSERMLRQCPVQVLPVPSFLSAIRTASSYSIKPHHPPSGGIFYVINADQPGEARQAYQREFRILSAHETYPGHHFLDSERLNLESPLRRCMERPLFYEGWACFAEQLMQWSGYLHRAEDTLLLARRRLWRAVRGKVDLGLQTKTMGFESAVECLADTGIDQDEAAGVVRKYPLNPGYQLCYTLGFKQFEALFRSFGQHDVKGFVRQVVTQGEIGFDDLSRILKIVS